MREGVLVVALDSLKLLWIAANPMDPGEPTRAARAFGSSRHVDVDVGDLVVVSRAIALDKEFYNASPLGVGPYPGTLPYLETISGAKESSGLRSTSCRRQTRCRRHQPVRNLAPLVGGTPEAPTTRSNRQAAAGLPPRAPPRPLSFSE